MQLKVYEKAIGQIACWFEVTPTPTPTPTLSAERRWIIQQFSQAESRRQQRLMDANDQVQVSPQRVHRNSCNNTVVIAVNNTVVFVNKAAAALNAQSEADC